MKTKYHPVPSAAVAKSGDPTAENTYSIRCRWLAVTFAGILFALVFVLLPAAACADCTQWDASGKWKLNQSNKIAVSMHLSQTGNVIKGTASYHVTTEGGSGPFGSFSGDYTQTGSVDGTIKGGHFAVEISWDGKGTGVYRGVVNSKGILEGGTYPKDDPSNGSKQATWSSDGAMKCASYAPGASSSAMDQLKGMGSLGHGPKPAPAAPQAPYRGPIKHSGKPIAPEGASKAQGAPAISASPRVVTIPAGQTQGTTTLTWDAGADHPYAEVWVQVDNQDETKIVEQGKGSRQVKVESGKTYLYSLSDSGERLATITVKTNRP